MKKFNPFKSIGPGTLIAAAFIGPGTVTLCSKAGISFGYALLWALLLSTIATIVLQEMAARLGLISQKGLAEIIRTELNNKWVSYSAVTLIIAAILIGNSAYQAGNISGGVLGLNTIFPKAGIQIGDFHWNFFPLFIGLIAFTLLYMGQYKTIERALVTLVLFMSLSFIITALMTSPNWGNIAQGLFIPQLPEGSLITVIGLIGTTVVPYNLFLHASLIKEKWNGKDDLKKVRKDTLISIVLGGVVSLSIVIAAASVQLDSLNSAADLAKGLEPLYGQNAKYLLAIGLFSAGITSAITAPLAAAYVARECFGWDNNLKSAKFRAVWMSILMIGVLVATFGKSPIQIIQFAQVANGLLLPIIAIFLFWIMNQTKILGNYTNNFLQNCIGGIILFITIGLALKTLYTVFASCLLD